MDHRIERIPVPAPTAVLVTEVGGNVFYASLEDNTSAKAFVQKLSPVILTADLRRDGDSGFAGELPWEIPAGDGTVTTATGDIIIYPGNKIAVCRGNNTVNCARIARFGGTAAERLFEVLESGERTASFYLEWSE